MLATFAAIMGMVLAAASVYLTYLLLNGTGGKK
jgi:hypothetical protein